MKIYSTDRTAATPATERVKVGIAEYAIGGSETTLVTSGLGSCVGIALVDPVASVGGLAHAMLPEADASASDSPVADDGIEAVGLGDGGPTETESGAARADVAKYVDSAVTALIEEMVNAGASRARIEARLAGGSAMFEFTSTAGAVGERNIAAARAALERHDIPLVASDVGGDHGRSLKFEVVTAELTVRRAHGTTDVL